MKSRMFMLVGTMILTGAVLDASAFYNASTGRWLSRDPARQRAPESPYVFALNAPNNRFDAIGLDCGPMQVTDLGQRQAVTNASDITNGRTTPTSWVFTTTVPHCFPGFCTSQYKVQARTCWASIEYWYDSDDTKAHEQDHVNNFVNNWNTLLSVASPYLNTCVSQDKALCYQSLIDKYSDYLYKDA